MSEHKETRPTSGNVGRAGTETATCEAAISYVNVSTNDARIQVADFLHEGRENALTMRELQSFLNGNSRSLRLKIENERLQGRPILSGQKGYWLGSDPLEIQEFVSSMRHRARRINRTATAVERSTGLKATVLDGQFCLFNAVAVPEWAR